MPDEDGYAVIAALETLGMNNRDAWRAIAAKLQAEGVTGREVEPLRRTVWAERKRLRAARQGSTKGAGDG
jgi:hypothetical protein